MFIKPDFNLESIYDIDIEELQMLGIKAIFFDLDSTIMKSKSAKFAYKTIQYLNDLTTNFKLAIVTNNKNLRYIRKVKEQINIPVYSNARKPDIEVLNKVCKDLKVESYKVAMVGDRPLSDILGGKKAGMLTILVDSIVKDEENILIRFVRFLERLAIKN